MGSALLGQVLESQLGALGAQGLDKVKSLVDTKVATAPEGMEKNVYSIVSSAIDCFGASGVNKALGAIHDILDGKTVDMSWADLEASSNLLAAMQNQEASELEAKKVLLAQIGGIVKDTITGVIISII